MSGYTDFPKPAVGFQPVVHVAGILYLVGDSHLHEIAFTFAMTVKVETYAGNTFCFQLLGYSSFQTSVSVACKAMAKHNYGAMLGHNIRGLQFGYQLTVVPHNNYSLCSSTGKSC
jgi:hypothetical protein